MCRGDVRGVQMYISLGMVCNLSVKTQRLEFRCYKIACISDTLYSYMITFRRVCRDCCTGSPRGLL